MALSGSASKGFARHSLIIEWSATQSIADNNSTVTAKVYLQSNDQYGAMDAPATNYGSVTVNGVTKSFSATSNLSANQKKLLTTQTFTVGHSADGTKSFSFSTTYNINVTFAGVFYGNQTASGSATLNTIPRASSITSISGGTLGSPVTVTIARASNDFTHKVWYYRPDGYYAEVGNGVGTSLTFTPPIGDSFVLPNATTGAAKIEIGTYQNGVLIGGYVSKVFTVTVPASIVPNISNITFAESVAGLQAKFGAYVQSKSMVKTIMQGNGAYGSTITQKRITGNGQVANDFELNTTTLTTAGTNKFTYEVTDSRGRKASATQDINVVAYHDPRIDGLSAFRCNANGTANNEGTYVKVSYNATIASVGSKNDKAFKLRWKTNGGAWSEQALSNASYDLTGSIVLSGFNTDNSYELQLVATDYFVSVAKSTTVPSGFTLINYHESGKGLAFGGVMERTEGIDVMLDTEFKKPITIQTNTVGQTDDALARFRRLDKSLAVFLSLNELRKSLKLHMYDSSGAWKSYFEFKEDGNMFANGNLVHIDKTMPKLWNGAFLMNGNQTINISKSLFDCRNGWFLAWSNYTGTTATDADWTFTYIHKLQVQNGAVGFHSPIGFQSSTTITSKYLYLDNDTTLRGYSGNESDANKKKVVLRAVYEW